MATKTKCLADVHRRLKQLARKQGKRKRAKHHSLCYEGLEVRRVLNAAPVGVSDLLYSTSINSQLIINQLEDGLLANDFDLDHDLVAESGGPIGGGGPGGGGYPGPLYVLNPSTLTTTVAGGTINVDIDGDGTFIYTPPADFIGFDYFTYQVVDASSDGLASTETLVAISVGQSLSAQLNGPELIGDNPLHTGTLQTTQSLGDGLELIYRSDTTPTPIVAVETLLLDGAVVPDSIEVETWFGGISSGITTYSINPATFDPTDPLRFVQRINAPTLATGYYDWTMSVTLKKMGQPDQEHEFTGQQAVINRASSEFGTGWWLAGLDRLHVTAGEGALLENADGSTYYFADNGPGFDRAVGDQSFATLEHSGSGYLLTDKWGDTRTFNSTGRITSSQRLNSSLPDFTFQYVDGKLHTITDISGRVFDFNYAAGFLDNIVDFAGRTTELTINGSGLLTEIIVADEAATADYPFYVAPQWTFAWQTIGGQKYLQSVTDPADATTSYQFNSQTRRLNLITHADASTWQLYPALTQGHVTGGNVIQTSQTDPRYIDERGQTYRFQTDGFGNTVSFVDARSALTTSVFDANGQLVRSVGADPDGTNPEYTAPVTRYGYSELGDLVLIVNADNTTQRGEYHPTLHRVTKWTNELGDDENFTYFADGDLQTYADARDIQTHYLFDSYGNLTQRRRRIPMVLIH